MEMWSKRKYFQGAEEFVFRDLGRSMHYLKGTQIPPPRGSQRSVHKNDLSLFI